MHAFLVSRAERSNEWDADRTIGIVHVARKWERTTTKNNIILSKKRNILYALIVRIDCMATIEKHLQSVTFSIVQFYG